MRKDRVDKLFCSFEQGVLTLERRLRGARLVGDSGAALTYLEAIELMYEAMASAACMAGDDQRVVDYRTRKLVVCASDPSSVRAELDEILGLPMTSVQWAILNDIEMRIGEVRRVKQTRTVRRKKPPES